MRAGRSGAKPRSALRIALAMLVGFMGLWLAPRASASCHSFTVTTDSPVTEGNKVKVTVSRDNNRDASSVQVQTGNKTAIAGSDYEPTITRVEFTDERSRTIEIATEDDNVGEDNETFQVKLNSARGCRTQNTDYQYGSPATVTIKDDDDGVVPLTPKPTIKPTAEPTSEATSTPEATASAAPSAEPTDEPTASPEETAVALPTPEPDDDGLSPWLVAAAIGALVLAASGALIATRMRRV
jgi:hypothetical protein